MQELDIPIFKKAYDLYRTLHQYRKTVNKQDRNTVWQRIENLALDLLRNILQAAQTPKSGKLPVLEQASINISLMRVFVRLAYDIKAIDSKKYLHLESIIDETGRMLGGWIRSTKNA